MNSLKEVFSWKNMLKNLNFFCELNLGLILTAVGIVYFKNPNHFAFGGTSGLSILLAADNGSRNGGYTGKNKSAGL